MFDVSLVHIHNHSTSTIAKTIITLVHIYYAYWLSKSARECTTTALSSEQRARARYNLQQQQQQ